MPQFKYAARDKDGKMVEGVLAAPSSRDVLAQLRKMNLVAVNVAESTARGGGIQDLLVRWGLTSKRPPVRLKGDDFVVFTRQLSTMISAGIPLLESLEILAEQATDKGFKLTLEEVVADIRSGADLSAALGRHPRVFTHIYVSMVKSGEASGKLDEILVRLAEYQEASAELKREIRAAMTYPVISLVMVVGIASFLLIVIVPKFEEMFKTMLGAQLPMITQVVMGFSLFLKAHILPIVGALAAAATALVLYVKKSVKGRRQWDWLKISAPIFGPLAHKVCISRFSRTFGTLIQSGVPILGALEIVANTVGNVLVEEDIVKAKEAVRQGEQLAAPLAKSKNFPLMVTRMIAVGEKTGALEKLLGKISDFYDQQVRATVKSLTSIIEPVMIGLMGVFVGIIVVAIFLPIMKAPQLIKKGG